MKFLRINAKVLLILCLFSGILFLSTGCGDKDNKESDSNNTAETEKKTDENTTKESDNKTAEDNKTENKDTNVNKESSTKENNKSDRTDYTVWVANTTINTDKNQRSYKVIWGDTLWLISTAWEVPYQEIARYNNIPNPDLIYVDQIIYNPLFK